MRKQTVGLLLFIVALVAAYVGFQYRSRPAPEPKPRNGGLGPLQIDEPIIIENGPVAVHFGNWHQPRLEITQNSDSSVSRNMTAPANLQWRLRKDAASNPVPGSQSLSSAEYMDFALEEEQPSPSQLGGHLLWIYDAAKGTVSITPSAGLKFNCVPGADDYVCTLEDDKATTSDKMHRRIKSVVVPGSKIHKHFGNMAMDPFKPRQERSARICVGVKAESSGSSNLTCKGKLDKPWPADPAPAALR